MFTVTGPSAVIATVSELKTKTKETLGAAQVSPVYIVRDGKPVGGIVNMEMMALLHEALDDQRMGKVAATRLEAVRRGEDQLLDEDEFWTAVDARAVAAGIPPRGLRSSTPR